MNDSQLALEIAGRMKQAESDGLLPDAADAIFAIEHALLLFQNHLQQPLDNARRHKQYRAIAEHARFLRDAFKKDELGRRNPPLIKSKRIAYPAFYRDLLRLIIAADADAKAFAPEPSTGGRAQKVWRDKLIRQLASLYPDLERKGVNQVQRRRVSRHFRATLRLLLDHLDHVPSELDDVITSALIRQPKPQFVVKRK